MQPSDPKFKRLPKWARDYISALEREVRSHKLTAEVLEEKYTDSPVELVRYDNTHRITPLPNNPVRIHLGEGADQYVEFRLTKREGILVMGGDTLNVKPHASNVLYLTVRRDWGFTKRNAKGNIQP